MNQNIQAIIRIKPSNSTIKHTKNTITVEKSKINLTYEFSKVFYDCKQTELFSHIKPLIQNIPKSINSTVLCYGTTGSGKTFTMFGTEDAPGIIYNTLNSMFNYLDSIKPLFGTPNIKFSFYQIYNEKIFDIFTNKEIILRSDSFGNVLSGLTENEIKNVDDFNFFYEKGRENINMASTNLNINSSRSHVVLSISIVVNKLKSKINLVDLAGSENNRKTGNEKERMKESVCINKSLFVLNNVVNAIVKGDKRIPYRDSKLTRVLQDSIGGNNSTIIIGCVCFKSDLHDLCGTLDFVGMSSKIVNKIVPNEIKIEENNIKKTFLKRKTIFNNISDDKLKKNKLTEENKIEKKIFHIDQNNNYDDKHINEIFYNDNKVTADSSDRNSKKYVHKNNFNCINTLEKDKENISNNYKKFFEYGKDKELNVKDKKNNVLEMKKYNNSIKRKVLGEKDCNSYKIIQSYNSSFNSSFSIIENTPKSFFSSSINIKDAERNVNDEFLSPRTKKKSHAAFYKRALIFEKEGKIKKAIEDYKTMLKIQYSIEIEEKIKLLSNRKKENYSISKNEIIETLNSGDFLRIKKIKNIGDKRAEKIIQYTREGNRFKFVEELGIIFSENIVKKIIKIVY